MVKKCGLFYPDAKRAEMDLERVPDCLIDNPTSEDCKECVKTRKIKLKEKKKP